MNKYQEALDTLVEWAVDNAVAHHDLSQNEFIEEQKLLQELVDKFNDDAVDKAWMEGYLKCQEEYGL